MPEFLGVVVVRLEHVMHSDIMRSLSRMVFEGLRYTPMSRYLQYSVIHRQTFRVFAEGAGPTGRGAKRHREAESRQYTSMFH